MELILYNIPVLTVDILSSMIVQSKYQQRKNGEKNIVVVSKQSEVKT